jgi:hypothetical protein
MANTTNSVGPVVFRIVDELDLWAPQPPEDVLVALAIEAGVAPEAAADVVQRILGGFTEGWRLAVSGGV